MEADGAFLVGAIDARASGLQAREDFGLGQAEGSVESDGDHGEVRAHGGQDFRRSGSGAAVMADFQ